MQVTSPISTRSADLGHLTSPPVPGSTFHGYTGLPHDEADLLPGSGSGGYAPSDPQHSHSDPDPASVSIFQPVGYKPGDTLTQMVQAQTKSPLFDDGLSVEFVKGEVSGALGSGLRGIQRSGQWDGVAVSPAAQSAPGEKSTSKWMMHLGISDWGALQAPGQWLRSTPEGFKSDGAQTDTVQRPEIPPGHRALNAGDLALRGQNREGLWIAQRGARDALGSTFSVGLADSMPILGAHAVWGGDLRPQGAFPHRLHGSASIETENARGLNLEALRGRLEKMAFVDPMGGVWGSTRGTEVTDALGGHLLPAQVTPNQFEGYDLGTGEGMKNFLVDVSLARSLNMPLPRDMVATAQMIASSYFGESGSMGQTTRNILRANDQILSDRFLVNAGKMVISQALNERFGTHVDFSAVSKFEGGQMLKGYVPMKDGEVLGRSGVTIATGYDIGQMSETQLEELGFAKELEDKLRPYTNLTKADAVEFLRHNPLTIHRADAMQIDFAVKAQHLGAAIQAWNGSDPTQKFTDLTRAQQTVLFSRTFHQGTGMPQTAVAQDFYGAALRGRWVEAETALRAYDVSSKWYKNRVGLEADLLRKERSK